MSDWPHAPPHHLENQGLYMVTAGTYQKAHFFRARDQLSFLQENLLALSFEYGWELHAWAVFSNHYHFVGRSGMDASNLSIWIAKLHQRTAAKVNAVDQIPNRRVWYQFWDSAITIHKSYIARLNYVHRNAEKHGLVNVAAHYPWCSAAKFEGAANVSFIKSVYSFDYNKVKVFDDF